MNAPTPFTSYATDAIGHRTAVTIESGTLYHDGRIEAGEKVA